MLKSLSLRNKLRLSFGIVSFLSILIATSGLLAFFYADIAAEARRTMRNKANLAMLQYRWTEERTRNLAESLAADKAVQVLADLGLDKKLHDYLAEIAQKEDAYNIYVFGREGNLLTFAGKGDSLLLPPEGSLWDVKSPLLASVIADKVARSGTERAGRIVAIDAAAAMKRNRETVGYVLTQYELDGAQDLVKEIAKLTEGDATIYHDGSAVAATGLARLTPARYSSLAHDRAASYEEMDLRRGGYMAQYRALVAPSGEVIGFLGITEGADTIVDSLRNTLLIGLAVLVVCMVFAFFLAELITRSIIVPVRSLLEGVNRITSGDLSYEIMLDLKDEIGKLGESFNQMRVALREKISTIEEINEGLELSVQQRTKTIEDLLNKMRKYLSPQLFDSIAGGTRDIDTKKHYRKKLTVFFSDVVSFTATTETMEPEDLSNLLNRYLDAMAKIALKWGGTIDKFVGDAIMVFFGDPEFVSDKDHALRAVGMAIEMRDELGRLRAAWAAEGFERPFSVRAGISTGYCTIGNFGSENKMDYTIIGSYVNLAARLEAAAEPNTIYIAHETYSLVKDEYACARVGEMSLKGFSHPIEIFRVLGKRDRVGAAMDLDYISVEGAQLTIKERSLEPASLSPEEKKRLVKSLATAAALVKGEVVASYDEATGAWSLKKKA